MNNFNTRKLVRAGIIAGLYVVLSLITLPVASGAIQFRPSEALCLLPLIYFEAVPALFVGCMLSNLITGCAPFDIVLGSLITLISALLTYGVGKVFNKTVLKILFGGLFPVLLNAFILPLIWVWCYGAGEYMYIVQASFLIVSQSISIYLLGTPAFIGIYKKKEKGLHFLN